MDRTTIGTNQYGSREIAAAAIKMALSSDRSEEKRIQADYAKIGISTAAVDYGGEFINSVMKIIERAVVSAKRKALYQKAMWKKVQLPERQGKPCLRLCPKQLVLMWEVK